MMFRISRELHVSGKVRTSRVCPKAWGLRDMVWLGTTAVGRPALAATPSFEDLSKIQYEVTPSAEKVVTAASAVDLSGVGDPAPLVGGLAFGVALVGAAIFAILQDNGPKIKKMSPESVLEMLAQDQGAQLLDIRSKEAQRNTGSPDLKSAKKSPISLPYNPAIAGADSNQMSTVAIGWAERVGRVGKLSDLSAPVVLLDEAGEQGVAAAKEIAKASPKREVIVCVAGGAEAWLQKELPWKAPLNLGLNLDTLRAIDVSGVTAGTEKLVAAYKENPNVVTGGVAAVAVAGASIFLFQEIEAILQIVGVVFAAQFLAKRLVFAENREKTLSDIQYLIKDKIAAGEAGSDLRRLADAVLDVDADSVDVEKITKRATANGAASNGTAAEPAVDVPDNVQSARAWIGKWRAQQGSATSSSSAAAPAAS